MIYRDLDEAKSEMKNSLLNFFWLMNEKEEREYLSLKKKIGSFIKNDATETIITFGFYPTVAQLGVPHIILSLRFISFALRYEVVCSIVQPLSQPIQVSHCMVDC